MAFVEGERERLDQDFVQFQSLNGLQRVEVPNDNVGLESHVRLLAGSQVLTGGGDSDDRDVVIVPL